MTKNQKYLMLAGLAGLGFYLYKRQTGTALPAAKQVQATLPAPSGQPSNFVQARNTLENKVATQATNYLTSLF